MNSSSAPSEAFSNFLIECKIFSLHSFNSFMSDDIFSTTFVRSPILVSSLCKQSIIDYKNLNKKTKLYLITFKYLWIPSMTLFGSHCLITMPLPLPLPLLLPPLLPLLLPLLLLSIGAFFERLVCLSLVRIWWNLLHDSSVLLRSDIICELIIIWKAIIWKLLISVKGK